VFERKQQIPVNNRPLGEWEAVAAGEVPGNSAIPYQVKINLIELWVADFQQVNRNAPGNIEAEPDGIVYIAEVRAGLAQRLPAV
jgi:hypothetical protein